MTGASDVLGEVFIRGTPSVSRTWGAAMIDQTLEMPTLQGPCHLEIEIVGSTTPSLVDTPSETTLSHRLVRLLDALDGTLLRTDVLDRDRGQLVSISARQRDARPGEPTGVRLVLRRAEGASDGRTPTK